jgi:hypothetical protein
MKDFAHLVRRKRFLKIKIAEKILQEPDFAFVEACTGILPWGTKAAWWLLQVLE